MNASPPVPPLPTAIPLPAPRPTPVAVRPMETHHAVAKRLAAQFPGAVSLVLATDESLAHLGARRGDYVAFNACGDPVFLAFGPESAMERPGRGA